MMQALLRHVSQLAVSCPVRYDSRLQKKRKYVKDKLQYVNQLLFLKATFKIILKDFSNCFILLGQCTHAWCEANHTHQYSHTHRHAYSFTPRGNLDQPVHHSACCWEVWDKDTCKTLNRKWNNSGPWCCGVSVLPAALTIIPLKVSSDIMKYRHNIFWSGLSLIFKPMWWVVGEYC